MIRKNYHTAAPSLLSKHVGKQILLECLFERKGGKCCLCHTEAPSLLKHTHLQAVFHLRKLTVLSSLPPTMLSIRLCFFTKVILVCQVLEYYYGTRVQGKRHLSTSQHCNAHGGRLLLLDMRESSSFQLAFTN